MFAEERRRHGDKAAGFQRRAVAVAAWKHNRSASLTEGIYSILKTQPANIIRR